MARESAEDKIARIVRDTLAGERRREEEERNPAYGRLRQLIREEVGGVLTELLDDREPRRSRSRRRDEGDDEGDNDGGLLGVLGL